jgi:hypothetical protein
MKSGIGDVGLRKANVDSPLWTRRMFSTEPSELIATYGIA